MGLTCEQTIDLEFLIVCVDSCKLIQLHQLLVLLININQLIQ